MLILLEIFRCFAAQELLVASVQQQLCHRGYVGNLTQ
jgi:hypothetical protein